MKKILLTTAMCMLVATPALANMDKGDVNKKADMYFSKIDSNGDGYISKSEHEAFGENMFQSADTNKDGKVSKEELRAEKMKERNEWKAAHGDKYNSKAPAAGKNYTGSSNMNNDGMNEGSTGGANAHINENLENKKSPTDNK